MSAQTTIKRKINLRGIGLHAGTKVTCVLHPAPANHGIVFMRSDLGSKASIRADISKVIRTDMSTTLGSSGAVVATVEHLMAALVGMGVDNVLVELNAPEVPIMDGSSLEFADAIADSGVRELSASRKYMLLKEKISIRVGDKSVLAKPAKEFSIKGSIEFDHKSIGSQSYTFNSSKDFREEIASARTFGFLREVEFLHKRGLAKGGSLDNAVVLDDARVLNPEGLRFRNEFVRHKVLDALGDFALLGMPILGAIEVHKAGHELHTAFLRKVLEDPRNYEIVEPVLSLHKSEADADEEDSFGLVAPAY